MASYVPVWGRARSLVRDTRGAWVLLFDLGGQSWRVGSRQLRVPSRRLGATVAVASGLSALDFTVDGSTAQVTVRGSEVSGWATARRRHGPLMGRRFELWRYYQGDLEDNVLALDGVITDASWGDPGDPNALALTLSEATEDLSLTVPPADAIVNAATWPLRPAYPVDEGMLGQHYPVVIGHPGVRRRSGTAAPLPSTPGLLVEGAGHPTSRLLVAGHRVEAEQVEVHNLSTTPPTSDTRPVQTIQDGAGRTISYVDFVGTSLTPAESEEWVIGWDDDPGWGGGVVHQGRVVDGLGDMLIWGASTYSRHVWDYGRMEAERDLLNQFRIGTYINAPVKWSAYLSANVESLFDVELVKGPRGRWYRLKRFTTDSSQVVARLTTTAGGSGIRVQRVSGVSEEQVTVANYLTVEFDPVAGSTSAYRRRTALGPRTSEPPSPGSVDVQTVGTILAAHSEARYGPRTLTIQTVMTSDLGTAQLVARRKLDQYAMPAQLVWYQGGAGLAGLQTYQTVELDDQLPGADFRSDLGLVQQLVMSDDDTFRVLVRVPYDPLRSPTLAA